MIPFPKPTSKAGRQNRESGFRCKALSNEVASASNQSPSPTFTPSRLLAAQVLRLAQVSGHIQTDLQEQIGRREMRQGVLPGVVETTITILYESTKKKKKKKPRALE